MAVDTAKRLYGPAQPGVVAATVYTVPAATTTILRSIIVVNTTALAATITLSIGADAAGNRVLFSAFSIPANSSYVWNGLVPLAAAEIIQAFQGTAAALTLIISGVETA